MSNKITLNLNQSPYYDDFDENKNFHQVLYKPALPVQARELTQQQSILRNQIKNFGDHIFRNGSKVTGGEFVLNLDLLRTAQVMTCSDLIKKQAQLVLSRNS